MILDHEISVIIKAKRLHFDKQRDINSIFSLYSKNIIVENKIVGIGIHIYWNNKNNHYYIFSSGELWCHAHNDEFAKDRFGISRLDLAIDQYVNHLTTERRLELKELHSKMC